MSVFIDTSAFLAVLNADDGQHQPAADSWTSLITGTEELITTNYVVVATIALLQRRLGMEAVRAYLSDVIPIIGVEWVLESTHGAAMSELIVDDRRYLSLVDCVSFQTMRRLNITRVFCFDRHFQEKGFTVIPL